MNAETLDGENFIENQDIPSKNNKEEEEANLEDEVIQKKNKQKKIQKKNKQTKFEDKFLNKKRAPEKNLKYPLKKIIDFSSSNKLKICKTLNLISKEVINIDNFFTKSMFLPNMNIDIKEYINNLIEFKLDSLSESINNVGFYNDKIKPYIILYSSNCYDLIKYEKMLKNASNAGPYNIIILNFFGKHKKLKEEISKIRDKFDKTKNNPNTFYVILATPNRIFKLSKENLLDYSFLKYNILDLTPNIKNLTFLDMKDCREDFFIFLKNFLTTDSFNKTKYIVYINSEKKDGLD